MVEVRTYRLPAYRKEEIFRYAGVRKSSPELEAQLQRRLDRLEAVFQGRVCFLNVPVTVRGNGVDLGFARTESAALARNLNGCGQAVVFAATVGMEIDRLIRRCSVTDLAGAVWLQAIGTERIEALCRLFCGEIQAEAARRSAHPRPRFSPGYGDLSITLQRDIFRALRCAQMIGVSLSEQCLMTPSKSVTAIVGIGREVCGPETGGCAFCDQADCSFRKENL